MKNDEQLFFKIDDYLKGRLSPEEAAAFSREMAADPELARAVELQRFEREGLEYLLEKDLRDKMKAWKKAPANDDQKTPPDSRSGRRNLWLGLMAIALLVAIGFFFFRPSGKPPARETSPVENPEDSTPVDSVPSQPSQNQVPVAGNEEKKQPGQPAENQYAVLSNSEYDLPENLRSGLRSDAGNVGQGVLAPAVKAFKGSPPDYRAAIRELEKIKWEEHPAAYDLGQEMLAHAYYNTKQFRKAAGIFESMANRLQDPTAHDRAEWYLLLSLLPDYERQKPKVNDLLKKMTEPAAFHDYREKASLLEEKLKK